MTHVSRIRPVKTARLAWFRPHAPEPPDRRQAPLDDTASLIEALRARYDIDVVDEQEAYAFVWRHDRQRYDLPVYELADTAAAQFIWPYLLRYPGLLLARSRRLRSSRAASLRRQHRDDDYAAELAFSGAPLARAPFLASRLVVVPSAAHAQVLQDEYPDARIRVAPVTVGAVTSQIQNPKFRIPGEPVRFGVLGQDRLDVIRRARQRARDAGTEVDILIDTPDRVLQEADVLLALQWSVVDEWPVAAVAGMAAGRPVVVLEMEATADWPAYDPQTWQPRDPLSSAPPVVISLDPRDEEHSLLLAMQRLAASAALRAELGAAGHAWWSAHAAPDRAADAWAALIDEAVSLAPPPLPADWPPHLRADGSDLARAILGQIGAETDIVAQRTH